MKMRPNNIAVVGEDRSASPPALRGSKPRRRGPAVGAQRLFHDGSELDLGEVDAVHALLPGR